jgi:HEAT repeat protein
MTFALAAVLLLPSVAQSRGLAPAEQRASLLTLLGGHHFRVDRKLFDRLGRSKEIVDHLVHFVSDPGLKPSLRLRATASLRVYPATRTEKFLSSLLYDPTLQNTHGVALRREAMLSLGIAFRGRAITPLSNHRDDKNPQIREGCARALGATRSTDALPLLDAWLPHEPELFVRLAVDKAIEYIRGLEKNR